MEGFTLTIPAWLIGLAEVAFFVVSVAGGVVVAYLRFRKDIKSDISGAVEALSGRLVQVETELSHVTIRATKMEGRIGAIEEHGPHMIPVLDERLAQIERRIDQRMGGVEQRIEQLATEVRALALGIQQILMRRAG